MIFVLPQDSISKKRKKSFPIVCLSVLFMEIMKLISRLCKFLSDSVSPLKRV